MPSGSIGTRDPRSLLLAITDLVVPPLCEACGDTVSRPALLCPECRGELHPDDGEHDGLDLPLRAAFRYEGAVAHQVMHRFKYAGARSLARELGVAVALAAGTDLPRDAVLVPVPASPERRRLRGYDQAELLAREVGGHLDRRVESLLRRRAGVRSQTRLGVRERERNLTGVFAARPRSPYCPVVLIDDVWTTGGTLSACRMAIEGAGHQVVAGLVAFRTPRRRPARGGPRTPPSPRLP
jgi:ComF family protein